MGPFNLPILAIITITLLVSAVLSAIFTKNLIPFLKKKQLKQYVREEGPTAHLSKTGTPSMGGMAIVAATILATLMVATVNSIITLGTAMMLVGMILFGIIGFVDDYEKAIKKNNLGLNPKQKIIMQFVFSAIIAVIAYNFSGNSIVKGSEIWFPFINEYVDLGIFYIPFVMFVLTAFSNAVNLTDGLDGLASGVTALVSFCMVTIGLSFGFSGEPNGFAAISGACLGFLMFNRYPAKIFMGDTGSMALGGALATGAIMMKMEILLAIAGLIYVIEALSVIIQVTYYKKTKKRIFKMAPIHHHFELSGYAEKKVAYMFWAATLVFCLLAIGIAQI